MSNPVAKWWKQHVVDPLDDMYERIDRDIDELPAPPSDDSKAERRAFRVRQVLAA